MATSPSPDTTLAKSPTPPPATTTSAKSPTPPPSTTTPANPPTPPTEPLTKPTPIADLTAADADLLSALETESRQWDKDTEIERILRAFRLNAYAVLGLHPGIPVDDIKKVYRRKSLLIHPDKTPNPRAPEAFDRLAKAQQALLDDTARARLDEEIADARELVMRERKWGRDAEELKGEEFLERLWPEKIKVVMMEEEARRLRRAKGQMQEEGRQQRREEEEAEKRKRKREFEEKWEETREGRVGSWREFKSKKEGGGKKGKKMKVLG